MRKVISCLLFALLLISHHAHAQVRPYGAPIACNSSAYYDASTNGATKLVTGKSGKLIYVCGYTLWGAGTGNVSLQEGTGTNCGTSTITLTPAFQVKAQFGFADASDYWRGLNTLITGDDLCINVSAGVAVQAIVYYSQF